MPVMDDTGVMKHKDGLDILIALPATLISLTPLETLPPYGCIKNRQTSHLTDSSGNLKTLVITALTLSFPGKRDGHNAIDTVEKA